MGYTTNFKGSFEFSRELTLKEKNELNIINEKDWRDDDSRPQRDSYYCQWVSNEDGTELRWDYGEKFYCYIEWLKWLIEKFFEPKNIKLNGEVFWQGEEIGDLGKITILENKVTITEANI